MLIFILFSILGYLLGSIPFGFIIPKIKAGIDIRKIGSKGITAANVSRALGLRWGILSGILDILKSAIPTCLALNYLTNELHITFVALMPTVGHIFPLWLDFKGGRGASTFFGASIALIGLKFFLLSFIIWLTILFLFKIVSLTNLLFVWIFSLLMLAYFPRYFIYGILSALLITFALRKNIKRLRKGKEPKLSFKW